MKTTGYMVDDLKETDPIRQDLSFFESNFDGLMPLEVTLDFSETEPGIQIKQSREIGPVKYRTISKIRIFHGRYR